MKLSTRINHPTLARVETAGGYGGPSMTLRQYNMMTPITSIEEFDGAASQKTFRGFDKELLKLTDAQKQFAIDMAKSKVYVNLRPAGTAKSKGGVKVLNQHHFGKAKSILGNYMFYFKGKDIIVTNWRKKTEAGEYTEVIKSTKLTWKQAVAAIKDDAIGE